MIFELPLNEHVRSCLRLESAFRAIEAFIEHPSIWGSKASIEHLNDIVDILDRSDLRKKLAQELNRLINYFDRLSQSPDVDTTAIAALQTDLARCFSLLEGSNDKFAKPLRGNEFLAHVHHHQQMPGGVPLVNTPALQLWLEMPANVRNHDLRNWMKAVTDINEVSLLLLDLLRRSSPPQSFTANAGFYQHSLDSSVNFQLVQVELADNIQHLFPQISASRHGISVRFYEFNSTGSIKRQTLDNVDFHMTCCVI